MSKKKKRAKFQEKSAVTNAHSPTQERPSTADDARDDTVAKQIEAAHEEAVALATETDLSNLSADARPEGADIDTLWRIAREARDLFREATARAESKAVELEKVQGELSAERDAVEQQKDELAARQRGVESAAAEVEERRTAVKQREGALLPEAARLTEWEQRLKERELNAEAGFLTERRQMLARLEEQREEYGAQLEVLEKQLLDWQREWSAERSKACRDLADELKQSRSDAELATQERLAELEKDYEARGKALDAREAGFAARERVLAKREREVQFGEEDLKAYRAELDQRVENKVAAEKEALQAAADSLQAQLAQARKDRTELDRQLQERLEAQRKFGQRTEDEVIAELEALRKEREQLRRALAERPEPAAADRLDQLERERDGWAAERLDLQRQVRALESRLSASGIAATELETLRAEKVALENGRDLMRRAKEELEAEVQSLIASRTAESPFPACAAIDGDREWQQSVPMVEEIPDLAEFVQDLQHRIANYLGQPGAYLYYSLRDLRSFLGGLAMSPLVLLQGISGTGKTSLPLAFARAVGNDATVIEVQAGWRDPQDLVGHFNAFEKRFHEREFLKALYRASTPRGQEAIHLIVLDEMNLSHPEQYFSDMLSALEQPVDQRRLVLMPHEVANAPVMLKAGSALRIPRNVWFVGTANHDETTKDFADKTYDRSHVMQFPTRPQDFQPKTPEPRMPVAFAALDRAFSNAATRRRKSAEKALEFLNDHLRGPLEQYFDIGWGPRLERQVGRYVPVVMASGGSIGEAVDHVIAFRLLRKLRNRHDNRPEHVTEVRKTIQDGWKELDGKSRAEQSYAMLDAELRRLGVDPEEEK